jgi:hypothetical protein
MKPDLTELRKAADDPNFKAWFGQSQLVDEDGKPTVFFRGEQSGSTHETFDRRKTRENGFFFTSDYEVASVYAGGRNVAQPRAFFLRADRHIDLRGDGDEQRKLIYAWAAQHDEEDFRERASGDIMDPVDVVQSGHLFDWEGNWSSRLWRNLQMFVEDKGYDAVTLPDLDRDRGMIPSTVVFKPADVWLIKPSPTPLPEIPSLAKVPIAAHSENVVSGLLK